MAVSDITVGDEDDGNIDESDPGDWAEKISTIHTQDGAIPCCGRCCSCDKGAQ